MTTVANFRVQVAAKLGLDNSSGSADRTLMLLWANQAYEEILARSRCYIATTTQTLTPGTADYTLATTMLAMNDAFITSATDSTVSRLERVSAREILNWRIGTQNAGAPPVRYYALNGSNDLMVYPTPVAADVITYYYVPRPTALSGDSDEPSNIPAEWQKTVEYYMLVQGGQYVSDRPSGSGSDYLALYEAELKKLTEAVLHRGGRVLSRAVVGGGRRFVGRPDQVDA